LTQALGEFAAVVLSGFIAAILLLVLIDPLFR
jgi:hypothetical protein